MTDGDGKQNPNYVRDTPWPVGTLDPNIPLNQAAKVQQKTRTAPDYDYAKDIPYDPNIPFDPDRPTAAEVKKALDEYDLSMETYVRPTLGTDNRTLADIAGDELRARRALETSAFDIPEPLVGLGASGDPKGEAGAAKPGLGNISVVAQYYEGAVMQQGEETYGAYNWCEHPMKASTYYEAILRHLNAWWTGEDLDPKSGHPHMAHIRASGGIIIDQQETGRMIDDRPKNMAPIEGAWNKIMAIREKRARDAKKKS